MSSRQPHTPKTLPLVLVLAIAGCGGGEVGSDPRPGDTNVGAPDLDKPGYQAGACGDAPAAALDAQSGCTYYLAPNGDDAAAGTPEAPWATFDRAWKALEAGQTLCLGDGVYCQSVRPNERDGLPGKPITVKALHDGKAIIDAQGKDTVMYLGNYGSRGFAGAHWYTFEGLVLRNGKGAVMRTDGNHSVFRRMSFYNSDTDDNSSVVFLAGNENLVEDCIAAGSGRYMLEAYEGKSNTLRRCFTMWQEWNGREFCGIGWPTGYQVGVYNASNTTVENVLAYGRALTGIMIQANHDSARADNNQILGSIAVKQGWDYDGSRWFYGQSSLPTYRYTNGGKCDGEVRMGADGGAWIGFFLFGQGTLTNNLFRDIVAVDNVGSGLFAAQPYQAEGSVQENNVIDHATIYRNAAQLSGQGWDAEQGGDVLIRMQGVKVTNSRIPTFTQFPDAEANTNGEGARIRRYVDRNPEDGPVWEMQQRALDELGVDVQAIWDQYTE